jgi:hypothetical protein
MNRQPNPAISVEETPSGSATRVVIGVWNGDPFGERARRLWLEAQRQAVLTDVGVAGPAEPAGAVAEVERDGDVVAFGERRHVLPHGEDTPGGFVAEDVAGNGVEPAPVPVALPGVPVAPADPTGLDIDDRAIGDGGGGVDLVNV